MQYYLLQKAILLYRWRTFIYIQLLFSKHHHQVVVLLQKCKDHCDPDLWPFDPKINRGHVLDMTVHPVKFYSVDLILKLLSGNCFLLPNMDNHPMKFEYYEGCPKNSCTALIIVRVINKKLWIIYHLKRKSVSNKKTKEKSVWQACREKESSHSYLSNVIPAHDK
jgi:hypothetical protein